MQRPDLLKGNARTINMTTIGDDLLIVEELAERAGPPDVAVVGGELEEMLFVEDTVAAEAGHRAERRPAVDTHLLGLLEQPLEQGDVTVRAVLMHVEAKQRTSHEPPQE